MFQKFEHLNEVPTRPNPFITLFLPELNPYKLALIAVGFLSCVLCNLKVTKNQKQSSVIHNAMLPRGFELYLVLT